MSSWGSSSKILKLQQVGDFSFFRSKSSVFFFTSTREAFFAKKYQFFIFLCLLNFIEDFIKDFTNNSRCTLAYLFLPSGFSESPTPTSEFMLLFSLFSLLFKFLQGLTILQNLPGVQALCRFCIFFCFRQRNWSFKFSNLNFPDFQNLYSFIYALDFFF